ncbi:hypothetical protein [Crateriforma conspicua]|nr:hypothetical protein [Crateriforma conspicua]
MKRKHRYHHLLALTRRKQRQVVSRLDHLCAEHGHPLPAQFMNDPLIERLGREIAELECEVCGMNPDLTAEMLYPEEFFWDDYFMLKLTSQLP